MQSAHSVLYVLIYNVKKWNYTNSNITRARAYTYNEYFPAFAVSLIHWTLKRHWTLLFYGTSWRFLVPISPWTFEELFFGDFFFTRVGSTLMRDLIHSLDIPVPDETSFQFRQLLSSFFFISSFYFAIFLMSHFWYRTSFSYKIYSTAFIRSLSLLDISPKLP